MARVLHCDSCKAPITESNPLVAKLFITKIDEGVNVHQLRNTYTAHMDIGRCCVLKADHFGTWQKRKPRFKARSATKPKQKPEKLATPQGEYEGGTQEGVKSGSR